MKKGKDFTKEEILDAVEKSGSLKALLINLGYSRFGYSQQQKKRIQELLRKYGINEQTHGHFFFSKKMFDSYVAEKITSRVAVKRRFKQTLKPEEIKCSSCHIGEWWNGKHLVLQLEHKNGIKDDHSYDNLRLLCPNCHSQTETFSRPHKVRKNKDVC